MSFFWCFLLATSSRRSRHSLTSHKFYTMKQFTSRRKVPRAGKYQGQGRGRCAGRYQGYISDRGRSGRESLNNGDTQGNFPYTMSSVLTVRTRRGSGCGNTPQLSAHTSTRYDSVIRHQSRRVVPWSETQYTGKGYPDSKFNLSK